jgi:DNA polymerase V
MENENDILQIADNSFDERFKNYHSDSVMLPGFPSPADDYMDREMNLNEHLVRNRYATFFMKVSGNTWNKMGVYEGDLLVVDRSEPALDGRLVVAAIDGDLYIKQVVIQHGVLHLMPGATPNQSYLPDDKAIEIWGVIIYNIHRLA